MAEYAAPPIQLSPLIEKLKKEKEAANKLQERKHEDWRDNYELYRNRVKTNRLTQRQAVNIPLMKETIKTLLPKIDEDVNVEWRELGGDEDKEILLQEIWDMNRKENKLDLTDSLDKKNVLLYGIGTKKLNLGDKGISITSLDPYDVGFDPLMSVSDIESSRFIVHQNIFRSVREIMADERYEDEGKKKLFMWVESPAGISQSEENKKAWEAKMERLKDMGVEHQDFPLFAGGDRIVNLTEHFTNVWNTKNKAWERRVVVYADEWIELLNEPLKDMIGVDFWPFTVWAEDPEHADIYSDSVADLVRTPNKVLNVWFSQMLENRTLKNFQMHWFLPQKGYIPQTYVPGPGAMLPAPPGDDINKVIKPVEISGLEDTMAAINALTMIVERGTGATAIEKGTAEKGTQTLGEVQILVGKSVERAIGMAKFYRMAWYETCVKWSKMLHANAPKILNLYKTSRTGKVYTKRVYASDWKSDVGYEPEIISSSEREQDVVKSIQKFMFLLGQFPNNGALRKIAQRRMLESVDLSPEEMKQINEDETASVVNEGMMQPQQQLQDFSQIEDKINQLAGMAA
jgi:hypothetical protein